VSEQEVTIRVDGSTWRFRLAGYLRQLRMPRMWLPLLAVALVPVGIDVRLSSSEHRRLVHIDKATAGIDELRRLLDANTGARRVSS
jgi:hypothetical protein